MTSTDPSSHLGPCTCPTVTLQAAETPFYRWTRPQIRPANNSAASRNLRNARAEPASANVHSTSSSPWEKGRSLMGAVGTWRPYFETSGQHGCTSAFVAGQHIRALGLPRNSKSKEKNMSTAPALELLRGAIGQHRGRNTRTRTVTEIARRNLF
jgi:hypothetical protein